MDRTDELIAVGIFGSPSTASKSTLLAERALALFEREGARTHRIALAELDAADLLGRARGPALTDALDAVARADVVVSSTPVYRETFSGLLKVFFDLLPRDALAGRTGLVVATGALAEHARVVEDVGRLFRSVGAIAVPGVYGLESEFRDGRPVAALTARVDRSASAALARTTRLVEARDTTFEGRPEVGPDR